MTFFANILLPRLHPAHANFDGHRNFVVHEVAQRLLQLFITFLVLKKLSIAMRNCCSYRPDLRRLYKARCDIFFCLM